MHTHTHTHTGPETHAHPDMMSQGRPGSVSFSGPAATHLVSKSLYHEWINNSKVMSQAWEGAKLPLSICSLCPLRAAAWLFLEHVMN